MDVCFFMHSNKFACFWMLLNGFFYPLIFHSLFLFKRFCLWTCCVREKFLFCTKTPLFNDFINSDLFLRRDEIMLLDDYLFFIMLMTTVKCQQLRQKKIEKEPTKWRRQTINKILLRKIQKKDTSSKENMKIKRQKQNMVNSVTHRI